MWNGLFDIKKDMDVLQDEFNHQRNHPFKQALKACGVTANLNIITGIQTKLNFETKKGQKIELIMNYEPKESRIELRFQGSIADRVSYCILEGMKDWFSTIGLDCIVQVEFGTFAAETCFQEDNITYTFTGERSRRVVEMMKVLEGGRYRLHSGKLHTNYLFSDAEVRISWEMNPKASVHFRYTHLKTRFQHPLFNLATCTSVAEITQFLTNLSKLQQDKTQYNQKLFTKLQKTYPLDNITNDQDMIIFGEDEIEYCIAPRIDWDKCEYEYHIENDKMNHSFQTIESATECVINDIENRMKIQKELGDIVEFVKKADENLTYEHSQQQNFVKMDLFGKTVGIQFDFHYLNNETRSLEFFIRMNGGIEFEGTTEYCTGKIKKELRKIIIKRRLTELYK